MEEWKSIPGYEGLYEISSYGRVKSLEISYIKRNGIRDHKPEIILTPKNNGTGYFIVCLYKNKTHKYCLIHRLVAQAFIPNPDNLPIINHKNEDKSDNRVENLEWCDHKYNSNYNGVLKKRSQRMKENGIYEKRTQRMKENGIYEKIALKNIKYPELIGLDEKEYRKEYRKKYREEHREHYREHQREYMREYRKRKRGQ